MATKIIRTVCYFSDSPSRETVRKLDQKLEKLQSSGYMIQTKRICSNVVSIKELSKQVGAAPNLHLSVGTISVEQALRNLNDFYAVNNANFNLDLSESVSKAHVDVLLKIIADHPSTTFGFNYVINDAPSSPFFPSATYIQNGFSVGLQSTDLAEDCQSLQEWLDNMRQSWLEISELFKDDEDFLGIDSSVAPLASGHSSFINFIKKLGYDFSRSVTTDIYTQVTGFLKERNPKPVGLCGLMFPCLEDVELAEEYEKGNFSIERNIFLSLHSGLGIDTYPVGLDEDPARILEVLRLIRALSNKYGKPLSARFVSDGKANIGERTDFQNPYLADCVIRSL